MQIKKIYYDTGVDVFSYKGQKTLQKYGVEQAFNELYEYTKNNPFIKIIEIGTDYGGLTNLLADLPLSEKAQIYTFDINPTRFVSHNSKITFINKDVFTIQEFLKNLIETPGRTLLLCDGGNKRKEFETFHSYLKKDDIIMAHDYAPNEQVFNEQYRNKIWNWQEFQDIYACFPGLEPYLQETFAKYAWCIRVRV